MKLKAKGKVLPALEERANSFFERLLDSTGLGGRFCLQPAYADAYPGAPANSVPAGPSNVMKFSTGKLPKRGPSREIAEWENIEVLTGGERKENAITIEQAQKEVDQLRKAGGACHEYIAYEAAKLCGREEAIIYTWHIMDGAMAEDYIFRLGETLEKLFVGPKASYKEIAEAARRSVRKEEEVGFLRWAFAFIAKIWRKLAPSIEEDAINRPYMAHFYDPTREEGDRGLNIQNGEIRFQSALDRIKMYWELASRYYTKGQKGKAFCALGHIVHLISDLHVPAHVHNDIHGPTFLLGKLDSLEQWTKRADYPHLARGKGKMNITIWDSGPLAPPEKDESWNPGNVYAKLEEFVDGIARETQRFRSVDASGTDPDQQRTGPLSDEECYRQASVLIPRAIENSAKIIARFIDYHNRLYPEAAHSGDGRAIRAG